MNESSTPEAARQVVTAINAAIAAFDAHDAWHTDHDDHDGYPESDLQQQTAAARSALLVAFTLVGRLVPPPEADADQKALHRLIDSIGDALQASGAPATTVRLAYALITITVAVMERQGLDADGEIRLTGLERTITIHPKSAVTQPTAAVPTDPDAPLESEYQ